MPIHISTKTFIIDSNANNLVTLRTSKFSEHEAVQRLFGLELFNVVLRVQTGA